MLLIGWLLAAELEKVPGTGVSLVPPPGWQAASQFPGFVDPTSGASILVLSQPGLGELVALIPTLGDARTLFAQQRIDVTARAEFRSASGDSCLLLSGTQVVGELVLDKWVAICPAEPAAMVTLQSPQSAGLPRELAESALHSVRVEAAPGLEAQLAALTFSVSPLAPFRFGQVLGGTGLLLPGGPLDTDPTLAQPMVVVASQVGGAALDPATDPCAASLQYVGHSAKLKDAIVSRREASIVAGRAGCLLAGRYSGPADAERAFLQYLAISPGGYTLRLLAIGDPARLGPLESVVAEMAAEMVFR